ncbi:MAG: AEC family transporter [Victivallaceae bacterium]|nr:AEC family transporter [Victivallaceae bacterium]
MITQVIFAIIEIFTIFAIGAYVRHRGMLEEQDLTKLSKLVVDILFPMLVFSSITKNLDPNKLNELWIMPLAGFGLMACGALLGIFLKKGLKNRSPERVATFHHYCAINNYVFLPIIILSNLWGKEYLPLLFIMNIGSTIGFWTIGVALLGGNFKSAVKNIFSINLVAIIAAIAIVLIGIPVPPIVTNICTKLGSAAVPLMLLLIGAAIYGAPHLFKNRWDVTYLTIVRLIVIPLILVAILKLFNLPQDNFRVIFIVTLMPVSASSAVITRRFGGDPNFAGQAIIVTTIASIATIPVMIYFFG